MDEGRVTLRREDGKQVTIPITALSDEDTRHLCEPEPRRKSKRDTTAANAPEPFKPLLANPVPAIAGGLASLVALVVFFASLRRTRPLIGLFACVLVGGVLGFGSSLCLAHYERPLSGVNEVWNYAIEPEGWNASRLVESFKAIDFEDRSGLAPLGRELPKPLGMTLTGIACGLVLLVLSLPGRNPPPVVPGAVAEIRCPNAACQALIPASVKVCFDCGRDVETGQAIAAPRFLDVPHPKAGTLRYRFKNQALEVQRVKKGRPKGDIERDSLAQYTVLEVHYRETTGQWTIRQFVFWPTWLVVSILLKIITLGFASLPDPIGGFARQGDTVVFRTEDDSDIGAKRIVFPNGDLMRSFVELARRFMDAEVVYPD